MMEMAMTTAVREKFSSQAAPEVLAALRKPLVDDKAREALFGDQQYQRR